MKFQLLFIVVLAAPAVHTLVTTIQAINTRYSSETNVFFDFDDCLREEVLQPLQIPQLLIGQHVKFQFIYALDNDILAVVFVKRSSFEDIQCALDHVLHRMHHVNVLFVLTEPSLDPKTVFDWAWRNGYSNSLALQWTADGTSQLFVFQPFPHLTVVSLNHVNESYLQEPLTNFHKYPIRTPLANDPPRSFRFINSQGKLVSSGLFLKLFTLFVDLRNATLQEVVLPKPYPDGLLVPDMMEAMNEGKVDISLQPFLQQYDTYLCTYAFHLTHFYLMVPYSRPVEQYVYFILPFDDWTWTALAVTVFVFGLGIYAGYWAVHGSAAEFGTALLQAFCGVLNISFAFRTFNSKVLLFVYILLSVVGLMLSNMYLAQLSTFLTTRAYEKQLNTVEDVIASKLPISIAAYDKEVYAKLGAPPAILAKVEVVSLAEWHQQRLILNTSRIDIISSEKYSFFTYQQRYLRTPRVKKIPKPMITLAPGFALPFTSPYVSLYSDFFQRSIESGFYDKYQRDLNDDGIANGLIAFLDPDPIDQVPLTLQHFKISLFLLGGGFVLAVVCFCLELVAEAVKRRICARRGEALW